MKKPSNKDRDRAISQLYQGVQSLDGKIEHLAQMLGTYIRFRKDENRFSNWLKKQQEGAPKHDVQKDDPADGKNMETSTADQG